MRVRRAARRPTPTPGSAPAAAGRFQLRPRRSAGGSSPSSSATSSGSTKLGERVDPELLREIQAQYFSVCSVALHRHGGQIEKFIGDAVLCVFGLPRIREDDALRACRAALDLLAGIVELNERLVADWSVRLDVRIGINTGEVVTGDLDGTRCSPPVTP